jgi:hypothetical protein
MAPETVVSMSPKSNGEREAAGQERPLSLLSPTGLASIMIPC